MAGSANSRKTGARSGTSTRGSRSGGSKSTSSKSRGTGTTTKRTTGTSKRNNGSAKRSSGTAQQRKQVENESGGGLLLFILFCVLLFITLCVFGVIGGSFGPAIKTVMQGLFGSLTYVIPIVLMLYMVYRYLLATEAVNIGKLIFATLTVLCIGMLFALCGELDLTEITAKELYDAGKGGGVLFGIPAKLLFGLTGKGGAIFITIVLLILSILAFGGRTLRRWIERRLARLSDTAREYYRFRRDVRNIASEPDEEELEAQREKQIQRRQHHMYERERMLEEQERLREEKEREREERKRIREENAYREEQRRLRERAYQIQLEEQRYLEAQALKAEREEQLRREQEEKRLRREEEARKRKQAEERAEEERILNTSRRKDAAGKGRLSASAMVVPPRIVSNSPDEVHEITIPFEPEPVIVGKEPEKPANITANVHDAADSGYDTDTIEPLENTSEEELPTEQLLYDGWNEGDLMTVTPINAALSEGEESPYSAAEESGLDQRTTEEGDALALGELATEETNVPSLDEVTTKETDDSSLHELTTEEKNNYVFDEFAAEEKDFYNLDVLSPVLIADTGKTKDEVEEITIIRTEEKEEADEKDRNENHQEDNERKEDYPEDGNEGNVQQGQEERDRNTDAGEALKASSEAAGSTGDERNARQNTDEDHASGSDLDREGHALDTAQEDRGKDQESGTEELHGKDPEGNQSEKEKALEELPAPLTERSHREDEAGNSINVQPEAAKPITKRKYQKPPLSLLNENTAENKGDTDVYLQEMALKLQQTLQIFGVTAKVTEIAQGPSVTRFELNLGEGTKVKKILSLTDDLKLNLAVMDIRIEAPIPGKAAVGIEIPNREKIPVLIRDLLASRAFEAAHSKSRLSYAVGKDISGKIIVSDIVNMPHLLVAGATGSGKSVFINTLIFSILYGADPDEVKFIMIDPKVVELSVYNGIPHLLLPVVTDPKQASAALAWAVAEMERRYKLFANHHVRNISGYNNLIDSGRLQEDEENVRLCQILVIVDELADLMMVASKEAEESIQRLAQLARAAGIHMIIATQRPSVDVITGVIKGNIPSRIAFKVSSGVDSRTILDTVGAERLLGYGDMLFAPQTEPKALRVQGAFVSDEEVERVTDFLKQNAGEVVYDEELVRKISGMSEEADEAGEENAERAADELDSLFDDACRFVVEKDKASSGMLQRVFKIGFNRAARIVDQMEANGVVGPEEGTKARHVLMDSVTLENFLRERKKWLKV